MPSEEEVLRLGKKLEKMIASGTADHSSAADLLKALRDLRMTLEVLQKTKIGITVNNFRKASNSDETNTLAKSLIKSWKKLLSSDSASSNANKHTDESSKDENSRDSLIDSQSQDESGDAATSTNHYTSDSIRLKCRELLANALKMEDPPEGSQDIQELAAAIEDAIYKEFNTADSKYKTKIRSRIANLKDSKNPKLRENVLLSLISPERLAVMTSEEMASDDMRQLRAKFTKEAIDDHQMVMTGGTVTDLLKCGRCLKYKCTYNQVQTRSADEPMTTFVYCNNCGHRWKFC